MFSAQASELILNLAPTGMVPTRALSAPVPLQPDEIVADVLECAGMGITCVHLHARDELGADISQGNICSNYRRNPRKATGAGYLCFLLGAGRHNA